MCMALAALFAIIMAAGHGVQDDGEERTIGRDETVQAVGGGGHHVVVVSAPRHGYYQQREQLVRVGLPVLYPKRHRLVHPRPLPS